MEGPSLFLAQEQLKEFRGKKVLAVAGNTKIEKNRIKSKKVLDIFSWGKHLVFQFEDNTSSVGGFALRVHFLLFGTFEAQIDGIWVTGDYRRTREPRLSIKFNNGIIHMYNCSIKLYEEKDMKSSYDFSIDIMSSTWDAKKALEAIMQKSDEQIGDILLDQTIFSGVGNIIKNEVLSLVKINPEKVIQDIPKNKLKEIITKTQEFSHQFYVWRKAFVLRKNLTIYRKGLCPHCKKNTTRKKTGKKQRWSYFCLQCQR